MASNCKVSCSLQGRRSNPCFSIVTAQRTTELVEFNVPCHGNKKFAAFIMKYYILVWGNICY